MFDDLEGNEFTWSKDQIHYPTTGFQQFDIGNPADELGYIPKLRTCNPNFELLDFPVVGEQMVA